MKYLLFDIIWVTIPLTITGIVLFTIYQSIDSDYLFYLPNAIFIFITLISVGLIFFLEYSILRKSKIIKLFIIFAIPLLWLPMTEYFFEFQIFIENEGLQSMMESLIPKQQISLIRYVKAEMIFFGSSAYISSIAVIFRMIISLWRQTNTSKI